MRRVHLIAVNHPFMLDLSITLKGKRYEVTGSDSSISEENKAKLQAAGVNFYEGWDAEKITQNLDFVVPAAHIRMDNPEVQKAEGLNLQILSVAEFIYNQTKSKTRVVVTGSRGKSSMLAIILYVLKKQKVSFDYALFDAIPGMDKVVDLSYNSLIALIEGDELLWSPVKNKHKLSFYRPHIALITNILWEKTEVFPLKDDYIKIFRDFVSTIERGGKLIYLEQDEELKSIAETIREDITAIPYVEHEVIKKGNETFLDTRYGEFPIHDSAPCFLENLSGARYVCRQLGVQDKDFYTAISEISQEL